MCRCSGRAASLPTWRSRTRTSILSSRRNPITFSSATYARKTWVFSTRLTLPDRHSIEIVTPGPEAMTTDLFAPETYVASRRPLAEASPLPGWCYSSPEWHAREMEAIFRGPSSEWLCVGRVDQVPNPGDFYTIPLQEQPLIVARDKNGKVNVMSAVCRHRGAVITEGEGRCRQFMCPYHNWTYALDGELIATPGLPPPMDGSVGFNRADYGLTALTTDFWAGFVFVTFNPQPQPLLKSLGSLPAFLANYNLGAMQFTHRDIY